MATQHGTPQEERQQLLGIMTEIAEKSQRLVQEYAIRAFHANGDAGARTNGKANGKANGPASPLGAAATSRPLPMGGAVPSMDPLNLSKAYFDFSQQVALQPNRLMQAQFALWQDYFRLWQSVGQRMLGHKPEPLVEPARDDRRFRDPAWEEHALFDFIKQSYLLTSRWLVKTINTYDGVSEASQKKLDFYTRQFVDAMAPSNFVATNPEVLRATLESRGENLLRGLKNLLEDLERGKGKLAIKMTDFDAFELGRNLALTPGKVVYQNEMMQLVQYSPSTPEVHQRPLLIVPPWINKFYILDLQPKNSFIKYAVSEGFTVFVISWVNPDESYADKTFDDYLTKGPLAALDAIEKATGERDVNAIGYCLGGTLLASTLAYLAAKKDDRIKSATYFTSLVDFSKPGELGVFIDEQQLNTMDGIMAERGYLDGREMAMTFNMLRANDLVWSFVVNNYLLGKEPFPFDLLYWNSDSTRMPQAMHSFYLRKCYLQNALREPGGITLNGTKIDLGKIKTPSYFLSTREDHIAPWISTYEGTQIFKGDITFVLAGSGHIAGVINPPAADKYGYWTNDKLPADPDAWFEGADKNPGSWWPHWSRWLAGRSGDKVPAREPGSGQLPALEEAPGSYVKVRTV